MNRTYVILGLALLCAWTQRAHSQSQPLKGIVWDAPEPPTVRHLLKIHEAGVEAVRLPWVTDNALLEVADTLGLRLFQDMPLEFLPADVLLDTLEYAKRLVWQATLVSLRHPSAQHFGVSTKSDTSIPRACEYFEQLAEEASEFALYYTTAFLEQDQCSEHVDLVLVDVRKGYTPASSLENWAGSTPIGFASIGQKVDDETLGLRREYSPESQARYLENHLPSLLESTAEVIFVYRWQDFADTGPQWGLIDAADRERPAYSVLRGIYTDTQDIFAFDMGSHPRKKPAGSLILAWIVCFLVVILCFWFRRFSEILWRYFLSRALYRETLYRECALLGGASFVFVVAQGLLAAAAILIFIEAFAELRLTEAIAAPLNPYIRSRMANLASSPSLLVLVTVAAYLMFQLLSATFGALGARKAINTSTEQFFVISGMAYIPMALLIPMVMIAPSLNPDRFGQLALVIALTWIAVKVYCIAGSAMDCAAFGRGQARGSSLGILTLPFLSAVTFVILLALPDTRDYLNFYWHLIFRG